MHFTHTWIEIEGEIIDPTFDQFSEYSDCYEFDRIIKETYQPKDYLNTYEINTKAPETFFEGQIIPDDILALLARNPFLVKQAKEQPEALQTEDGYVFFRLPDGSYADHLINDRIDMRYESLDQLSEDIDWAPIDIEEAKNRLAGLDLAP